MRQVWVALAAALAATAMTGRQSGPEPLSVSAVRFYSPASATTTIEGVCELRLGALSPGVAQTVRYRLEVAVFDSAGLELQRNEWQREVPAAVARAHGATSVETFGFRAAPGRYRMRVRAIPETGPVVEGAVAVEAYAAEPAISDLLLATAVRAATDDTSAAPGEIRRGNLVLRTAPLPQLSPTEASLAYYAEVYPGNGAAADGELRVAVLGAGGRKVIETPPKTIRIGPSGGLTQGSVDLAGLPTGDYVLQLKVIRGDGTVTAQAPFAMGTLRVATAAAASPGAGTRSADPFAEANETQLDSMYAPLSYLLESREQGVYRNLALEGKQRFLREFWQRRGRQAMAQFYGAVQYANEAFREGGAGQIPGWRTDRGRIFLKNGRWDEMLQRPMASPKPFEVWKYTRERQRYYVFMDQSGVGHYVLFATNDRREAGLPNWEQSLSHEDYQDVARFLGLSDQQQRP